MLPDSTNSITARSLDSVLSVCVESRLSKAANLGLLLKSVVSGCAIANLSIILVVSISHRNSWSILFTIRLFKLFCLIVLLWSFYHLSLQNDRSPLQLVTMREKQVRKSFPTFVKEDSKSTTHRLVNRCQMQSCQWDFKKLCVYTVIRGVY